MSLVGVPSGSRGRTGTPGSKKRKGLSDVLRGRVLTCRSYSNKSREGRPIHVESLGSSPDTLIGTQRSVRPRVGGVTRRGTCQSLNRQSSATDSNLNKRLGQYYTVICKDRPSVCTLTTSHKSVGTRHPSGREERPTGPWEISEDRRRASVTDVADLRTSSTSTSFLRIRHSGEEGCRLNSGPPRYRPCESFHTLDLERHHRTPLSVCTDHLDTTESSVGPIRRDLGVAPSYFTVRLPTILLTLDSGHDWSPS